MIYAITFFGILLGASLSWWLVTGDQPKGTPLIVIWLVALAALFFVGYRRLYMNPPADEPQDKRSKNSPTKV